MAIKSNEIRSNGREVTNVFIPSDSKIQFAAGSVITLYDKSFSLIKGQHLSAPECILKSNNKDRYSVTTTSSEDKDGDVVSARIVIKYTVHKDNILPKFTGDSAIINFNKSESFVRKLSIISFLVDNSYVTSSGEYKAVEVSGVVGSKFSVVVKDASGGIVSQKINDLVISSTSGGLGKNFGKVKTAIYIPESSSATTYTVSILTGVDTSLASNVKESYTINQYAAAGINVSISSTTSTSLVVTGTTPVALNGIEVNSIPTTSLTAAWVITKGSGVKIYAHRNPTLSPTIAYNTNGSSDYTNTLLSVNGNTRLSLQPTTTQTNGTTVTLSLVHTILIAGTASVSPVLNLDNFISVKPPAQDLTVSATVGEENTRGIKLASENNIIPVSSLFMAGGWSTVVGPVLGELSAYGAYNSPSPSFVTFTSPSAHDWEVAGAPSEVSFTYKVNDGTTDSDTKTVRITLTT